MPLFTHILSVFGLASKSDPALDRPERSAKIAVQRLKADQARRT
ncbi:MAG: hypothetical protein QF614_05820 [SAR324 cluster bacterium]|jgi:hypothetical protein|nr:hypothetical protein [SAR324 cluster bacterium]MDP7318856.1 hypothetical protein [SAR324 cluster bacterium]MDP7463988.1 hypothetical protein [SAR324 cluster bacterium]|tara:strand:+ start:498 stop:629 length:132 start_codon:yes stop_codon:yes gene_type:complete